MYAIKLVHRGIPQTPRGGKMYMTNYLLER